MFAPRYFAPRYFPLRYFPNGATGELAVFSTVIDAIVTQIEALALVGITDAKIIRVKRPVNPLSGAVPTDVGVQIFGLNQRDVGGTNERDDTQYRVGVICYQISNEDQSLNEDRPLLWLQRIRRKFNYQRLTGVGDVYQCRVEPILSVDPFRFPQNYDVSNLVVAATAREVRTT